MCRSKFTKLKKLITSPQLTFLMEAHNGLSAKIVEETGFEGIWASGLSISASLGVRDNNEVSWTQVLDLLEFMSDITNIPILLDGDTGYGNFNNLRRLIRKLEQRQIAGVCIEDKLFPKTNSFINGENQPLADIDEFCGKIKAAKDSQYNSDFVVVARTEAFIAGWGLQEALKRAESYRLAGADAVLVHSKKQNDSDIMSFMNEWENRLPIVIVPTKYYSVPTEKFEKAGISTIIWANHNLRASIKAMQETSARVFKDQTLINIEDNIVTVSEIFRLQGDEELRIAEKKYLPHNAGNANVIILAASQGSLGELTKDIPKTLVEVNDKPILQRQIETYNSIGIKDITVVRGFKKEKINFLTINYVDNENFEKTKELTSLFAAKDKIQENTIIAYGDIIFKKYVLHELMQDENDVTIVVDADVKEKSEFQPFIISDTSYSQNLFTDKAKFVANSSDFKDASGEFIGLLKFSGNGSVIAKNILEKLHKNKKFEQMTICDLLTEIALKTDISIKFIKGSWANVNTVLDLKKADQI